MANPTSMSDEQLIQRITIDRHILSGQPIIRGTRLTVRFIVGLIAHGASVAEILDEYRGLTEADVRACLLFASRWWKPGAE